MPARTLLLPLPAPAGVDAARALDPEVRALVEALGARLAAHPGGDRALLDALVPLVGHAGASTDRPLLGETSVRAALDGAIDAWFFLRAVRDARGRITDFVVLDVNAAAEQMVSHPRADVVGRHLCEIGPTLQVDGIFALCMRVAERGEAAEVELRRSTRRRGTTPQRRRGRPSAGDAS